MPDQDPQNPTREPEIQPDRHEREVPQRPPDLPEPAPVQEPPQHGDLPGTNPDIIA